MITLGSKKSTISVRPPPTSEFPTHPAPMPGTGSPSPDKDKKSPVGKNSQRAFKNYATYLRPEKIRILYPSITTINEA